MQTYIKYLPRVLFFGLIVLWIGLFFFSSPDALIQYIGVENGYLIVFILAFLSGLSIFGLAPYHLVLMALAAGGLNPFLLALSACAGLALGDSTSYFLGYQGTVFIPKNKQYIIKKISNFIVRHEKHLPFYIFLYGALVPFSNDFVGVTTGLIRYSFWKVMIPLTLGTLVFNLVVAYAALYAYPLLQSIF